MSYIPKDANGRSFAKMPRRLWSSVAIALGLLMCLVAACNAAANQAQAVDYRLGPEDVIAIQVMDHPELSGEFLVPTDGAINLQRGGVINVSGKTLNEVSSLVIASLKKTLRDPDVSVVLKVARPQLVSIVGVVQKPGPYNMKPGWRITEGISAAGGILPTVETADCTVSILRAGVGVKDSAPLSEVLRGNETANKPLLAGDVVTIESVELIPIYVMGQVTKPGLYNLRKSSAGVLEAITVAGGATETAALSNVTITHLNGDRESINIVPAVMGGDQQALLKLSAGDMVVVPESTARFAVLGWVNQPGFFSLKDGHNVSLSDALGMAKGIDNKRGGLKKVAIIRQVDGKEQRLLFDVAKFTRSADASQNPSIRPGDIVWVPETSSPDWDKAWSKFGQVLSFLWLAH